jgi:membrane protease YdiL (CAAX protease family)
MAGLGWLRTYYMDNSMMLLMVAYELATGILAASYLAHYGWNMAPSQIKISWELTAAGVLVFLVSYFFYSCAYNLAALFGAGTRPSGDSNTISQLNVALVLLTSIVNAPYEELFLVAFIFRALKGQATSFIIGVSVLLRILPYFMMGPSDCVGILALGIFQAGVYWRYQRIWPLITAHVIFNLFGLMQYV